VKPGSYRCCAVGLALRAGFEPVSGWVPRAPSLDYTRIRESGTGTRTQYSDGCDAYKWWTFC